MIEVKNLSKIFFENSSKEFVALKDVNLHIKKGEISLLSGVSGSGKSTLLSLIAGLDKPSKGEVLVDRTSISKLPENFASAYRRKHIGMIFQSFNLIPTLNVLDNILLPSLPDKSYPLQKANELLKLFELENKKQNLAKDLSGGEAQRVAIIRALINSPKLILADEPTANLDEKLSLKLLDHLELVRDLGHTLLIATHDPLLLKWQKATSISELKKQSL